MVIFHVGIMEVQPARQCLYSWADEKAGSQTRLGSVRFRDSFHGGLIKFFFDLVQPAITF